MICGMVSALLGGGYVVMLAYAWVRLRRAGQVCDPVSPFAEILGWSRLYERLQPALQQSAIKLAVLEGGLTRERLIRWTAEGIARAYAGFALTWALAAAADNVWIGWIGTCIAGLLPVQRARELQQRIERRRMMLLMELPVLLSRLLVLVNAGEHVRRALVRTAERRAANRHLLYEELAAALAAMDRGESMNHAMEQFGRRCAVPEVKQFAAVLLMNAKRGGEAFVPALRDLTRQMWEKRKAAARTLGEQASSRLAFPLALIFLLIVVLTGAPALMIMK